MADKDHVLAADKQRRAAILAGDATRLAELLTDDYRYVHASGKVENKSDYLKTVAPDKFLSLEPEGSEVRAYCDVCVTVGAINLTRKVDGQIVEKRHQFTGVWVKQQGSWKLSVFQNSSKSAG